MARIRTIKPEFWTDEKIVSLPFEARLLFIGMWNFCDDFGFLDDSPARLKLQIFPADDIDVDRLLDILCIEELVIRGQAEGEHVLSIAHFTEHQRVSHPAKSQWKCAFQKKQTISRSTRRQVAEKYKCPVNGHVDVNCYSCGLPGQVYWSGSWIGFTKLELSHFIPESSGGLTNSENIVLCCRYCNRSMHTNDVLSHVSKRIPEDSGILRPEWKGMEGNGTERNGKEWNRSGPVRENRSDRSEDFDERLEVISGHPVLSEALAVAVEPLEPGKLAGGAFKAMETRHLAPAFVREWFRRQLAIDEPVLPGTRADLLLAIAAGLYAAKMPDSSVRKSRVAAFVNVISKRKWKSVGRYVHAAIESLEALEATERQEVGRGA